MSGEIESSLDDAAKTFAERSLNETDENRKQGMEEIKAWLSENPEIGAKTDRLSVLAFLRACKFDPDRTKRKIRNYYGMRRDVPEWFAGRDPLLREMRELAKIGVFVPLRKLHDNMHVVIIRTAAHDPKTHNQDDVFKIGKMILDALARDNETLQIYGVIAVFDMKDISLGHARQLTPSRIKKAVYAWQNYHCRPQQLEFINAPVYINVVLNIFKKFMSEKLKGRIRVHFSGVNTLHNVVDKSILPVEYGGDDGSIDDHINFWCKRLVEFRDWFRRDEEYKSR